MVKARASKKRSKKRSFHGNRFTKDIDVSSASVKTASDSKLNLDKTEEESSLIINDAKKLEGNRIIDISSLITLISLLCCPTCYGNKLKVTEDSRFGLCSNFTVFCNCGFATGFSSTSKTNKQNNLNQLLVLGLRLIGKGYSAGKKLLFTMNLPFISKSSFRENETKLLDAVLCASEKNMRESSKEVKKLKNDSDTCGVSVDGTWQRRGHTSLNGCVSVIAVNTGKVIDLEVMSQYCRFCCAKRKEKHLCANHTGSSGNMEVVGVKTIFQRSITNRELKYVEYYGDGDCKAFSEVRDIYGKDSVKKLECIGHVQKRVGNRLRNLKKSKKGLGGQGKLTDKFIDKLQNYYGIAIRSNVGNLKAMQSATIAAFFHCCSSENKPMHGQCPSGADSWCGYQRSLLSGDNYTGNSPGLRNSIINIVKPIYMSLCDENLLSKCLHGLTQNANESFNAVLWSLLPKSTFVELQTLKLGANIAVLIFNSGFLGLIPVFENLGITADAETVKKYLGIDKERINHSHRFSLPATKIARKKKKSCKKSKVKQM